MKIVSKTPAGIQPVYDLGLPQVHNFVLENGVVASNCFNKSHSVSYSMITYVCAWLKANYPQEFFCGLMTIRSKSMQPMLWAQKAPQYIQEAKILGVHIKPPSVNGSKIGFSIDGDSIYFGLNAIRNVGITAARSVTQARGKKPFADIYDFLNRVRLQKVTTKVFQALVRAGAFDTMGYHRIELLNETTTLYDYVRGAVTCRERSLEITRREQENLELSTLIDRRDELRKIQKRKRDRDLTEEELDFVEETKGLRRKPALQPRPIPTKPILNRSKSIAISIDQLLEQAEYIGCFIGTHPARLIYPSATKITSLIEGMYSEVAGRVISLKVITTRKGSKMCFMGIEDGAGIAEIVVFPNIYKKLVELECLPSEGDIVLINGKIEQTEPIVKLSGNRVRIYRSKNEL